MGSLSRCKKTEFVKLIISFFYYFWCPSKILFSNFFQLLWENWPKMTKTKKKLVSRNKKSFFFNLYKKIPPLLSKNWAIIFLRIFFWGIIHFCRSKNKDFRKLLEFLWLFLQNHMVHSKIVKFWAREKLNISKKSSEESHQKSCLAPSSQKPQRRSPPQSQCDNSDKL